MKRWPVTSTAATERDGARSSAGYLCHAVMPIRSGSGTLGSWNTTCADARPNLDFTKLFSIVDDLARGDPAAGYWKTTTSRIQDVESPCIFSARARATAAAGLIPRASSAVTASKNITASRSGIADSDAITAL